MFWSPGGEIELNKMRWLDNFLQGMGNILYGQHFVISGGRYYNHGSLGGTEYVICTHSSHLTYNGEAIRQIIE